MKHNSHIDLAGNLKIRGIILEQVVTEGGFYSRQFGETAYKSDLGAITPGGSITVAQGPNVYTTVDQLNFNTTYFYLTRGVTGDPVVNWDLGEGFKEREILLDGNSKNIFWNWGLANSFFLPLQKNTTLHEPQNYKQAGAQQVNLVTQQPNVGFYNVTFGRNFIFPGGAVDRDTGNTTFEANAIDLFSFHYSPRSKRILVMSANQFFY